MLGTLTNKIYNLIWRYIPWSLERIVARNLNRYADVLDLGCADGAFVARLKALGVVGYFVGVDIHEPYVQDARKRGVYDWVDRADIRYLVGQEQYDVVMCIMVIEHLEKDLKYEAQISNVARHKVILTTSNGFVFNPHDDAASQEHLCGYSAKEFRDLGYVVYGWGASRYFFGRAYKAGLVPGWIRPLFSFVFLMLTPLVYRRPELADHLICIKEKCR